MRTNHLLIPLLVAGSAGFAADASAQSRGWSPEPMARIATNSPHWGALDSRDEFDGSRYLDRLSVDLRSGDDVSVVLSSRDFDTVVQVWYDGRMVAENDDRRGGGTDSWAAFEAPYSGTYEVVVTTWASRTAGSYSLSVDVADRRPPPVSSGGYGSGGTGAIVGDLGYRDVADRSGRYTDSHWVNLSRGETLDIELSSGDFDTVVEVRLDGWVVATNDDARGTDSALRIEVGQSGQYEVVVTSYRAWESGRYTLSIDTYGGSAQWGEPCHDDRRPPPPTHWDGRPGQWERDDDRWDQHDRDGYFRQDYHPRR